MPDLLIIGSLIFLALVFDFINGFHDAANAIATIVATRVLSPRGAVTMAAIGNFIGALIFPAAVATTIGKGIVDPSIVTNLLIFCALISAIIWNLITWYYGLPSSSSHALIGGLIGAGIVSAGLGSVVYSGLFKVIIFIFIAPLLGMIGGIIFIILVMWLLRHKSPYKIDFWSRKIQIFSALFYSLGHGTNDAQKTMGIIAILLFTGGLISKFYVPLWVVYLAHATIALGTFFGGWRIIKTMGTKITKLRPIDGFCAETAGGMVLAFTAVAGIPISTTHVIAGSITGVGYVKKPKGVRWNVARSMVGAWIFTIPVTSIISGILYKSIYVAIPLL